MTCLTSLLELINYGFVLFFGIVIALYLADIQFEDNQTPYIASILILGAVQLLFYLIMGENLLYKCYPLLIHLPLILLIKFAFHRNIYIATISVLSAYLMCTGCLVFPRQSHRVQSCLHLRDHSAFMSGHPVYCTLYYPPEIRG